MNDNKGYLQQFIECKNHTSDTSACYLKEVDHSSMEKEKESLNLLKFKQTFSSPNSIRSKQFDFEGNEDVKETLYAESDKSKEQTTMVSSHPFSEFNACLKKNYKEISFVESFYNFTILIYIVQHMIHAEKYIAFIEKILSSYEDPAKNANKEISCNAYNDYDDLLIELNLLIQNIHGRFEFNGGHHYDMVLVLDLSEFNYHELKKMAATITKVDQLRSAKDKWNIYYKKIVSCLLVLVYLVFKCFWNFKYGGESILTLETIDEILMSYSNLIQYQFLSVDMILDFMRKYTSQMLYFYDAFTNMERVMFVGFDFMTNAIVFLYNILTALSNFDDANVNSQNPINFGIMQVSSGRDWWDGYLAVDQEGGNQVMQTWVKILTKSHLYFNNMRLNKQDLVDDQKNYYSKFALINKTLLLVFDLWYIMQIPQPQYILSDIYMVLNDAQTSKILLPQIAELTAIRYLYDDNPYYVNDGTFNVSQLIASMRTKLHLIETSPIQALLPEAIQHIKDLDYLFKMYENNMLYDFEFLSLYIWLRDRWRNGDQEWSNYSLMVQHNAPPDIVASRVLEDRIFVIYFNGLAMAPDSIRNQVLTTDEKSPGQKWKATAEAASSNNNFNEQDKPNNVTQTKSNRRFKVQNKSLKQQIYNKYKVNERHSTKSSKNNSRSRNHTKSIKIYNRYKSLNKVNDVNLVGQKFTPYKFDDILTKNILSQVNNRMFSFEYQFADVVSLLKLQNTKEDRNEANQSHFKEEYENKVAGLENEISELKFKQAGYQKKQTEYEHEQKSMKKLILLLLKNKQLSSKLLS